VELERIDRGLFRWTAPHPDWSPAAHPGSTSDWPRDVGCVLYEGAQATVFIDPLLPPDREPFLHELDERVRRRERPVAILTTIGFHRRSRDELARRYDASTSRAKASLPEGVDSYPLRRAGETVFWLPAARTLVPGDRILGHEDGGLRLCPASWLGYLKRPPTIGELKRALRPLLELPIERVLVSHGEPVLTGGQKALAQALS
jgi:hypothetical protein